MNHTVLVFTELKFDEMKEKKTYTLNVILIN
jgi:hypothetical protein